MSYVVIEFYRRHHKSGALVQPVNVLLFCQSFSGDDKDAHAVLGVSWTETDLGIHGAYWRWNVSLIEEASAARCSFKGARNPLRSGYA